MNRNNDTILQMQTDLQKAQNKIKSKWKALETRINNEDFERDTTNMEKEITRLTNYLAEIDARIVTMTAERENTSDRS